MKEIPFIISRLILRCAQQMVDANYDHQGEVVIGHGFELINKDEFQEIISFLDEEQGWEEFPRDFDAIVKTPHQDSSLALFEESEGS